MIRGRSAIAVAVLSIAAVAGVAAVLIRHEHARRLREVEDWFHPKGVIAYRCSSISRFADYDPQTAGPTELTLVAVRRPGKLTDWSVLEPGGQPMLAYGFAADSGSIGGSQGIRWREPGGAVRTAVLSFSDVLGAYGPETIWVRKRGGEAADARAWRLDLTCGPDPKSYRLR